MDEKLENLKLRDDLGTSQVRGANLLSYFMSIKDDKSTAILKQYGLDNLDPDEWYSMAKANGCLEVIAEQSMVNLVTWGMEVGRFLASQVPEGVPMIAVVEDIENTYQEGHRGDEIGKIEILTKQSDNGVVVEVQAGSPYPDDFEFGIFYSIVNALSNGTYGVAYGVDEDDNFIRRDFGSPYTTYIIKPREASASKRFAR